MDFIEKIVEMRAIKREEIVSYFTNINGVDAGNGKILGQGWEAEVGQEKSVALGSFAISSIIVVLRCKKELFQQMYSEFSLKFFRAGG